MVQIQSVSSVAARGWLGQASWLARNRLPIDEGHTEARQVTKEYWRTADIRQFRVGVVLPTVLWDTIIGLENFR